MRRPGLIFPAFALVATACQIGVPVEIDVRSGADIQFTIPQDHRENFCLNSATIHRITPGQETVVWRIQLRPQAPGPCRFSFAFPQAPPDFVTEVGADRLAPGSYRVDINGGLPQATGEFAIPSRN